YYRRIRVGFLDHVHVGASDFDDVAGTEHGGTADGQMVHDRPVEGPEVFDLQGVLNRPDGRMAPGNLRIVDDDVGRLPSQGDVGAHLDALPGERTGREREYKHCPPTLV